jgi:hypothetical protein
LSPTISLHTPNIVNEFDLSEAVIRGRIDNTIIKRKKKHTDEIVKRKKKTDNVHQKYYTENFKLSKTNELKPLTY